jgi:dimethylglycine oxidase
MTTMQDRAQTVIVGAGIVGVAAAYELSRLGARDILVIDQGPLFRTGGSTSHAPGLVFQNNPSQTVSKLAQWTVDTYMELSQEDSDCYFPVGSLEIATTPERWSDLYRKQGFATSWGLQATLLTPTETIDRFPLLDDHQIYGSIHIARDGLVRSVPMVERLAERARTNGVSFLGQTAMTGIDIDRGSVRAIDTTQGRIACERVLLCGGIWGPLLGELTGISIPLRPCAHPYIRTGTIGALEGLDSVVQPIMRHQDHSMYLWQDGNRIGVGSYRHEPHTVAPVAIANDRPAPADLPFDETMIASGLKEAERLMPAIDEAGITDRVYGMFSFTPDGNSIVGEVAEVTGLWTAIAVWVTHAAGTAKAVAQLMEAGHCELDLREIDVNRFAPHHASEKFVVMRGEQQYREVYDIIHPKQQISAPRHLRRAPWFREQQGLGAYFFESNGWERAQWYEANADLPVPLAGGHREGWNAREWSPICGAEHVATREACGLFDLGTFMRIELSGPDARAAMEHLTCSDIDRPSGRVTYALLLNAHGGIESDVTSLKLGEDHFQILTGSGSGPRDLGWIVRHTRSFEQLTVRDTTSGWCALGLWGPAAIEILRRLTSHDLSRDAFPAYHAQTLFLDVIPVLAIRMSYVGEDGFELHVPTEYGGALWDLLWEAGRPFGLIAAGGAAMDSLRMERGFRALGTDLRAEYTPFETGLGHAVTKKRSNYIGAEALATATPKYELACMALDHSEAVLLGKEPISINGNVQGYVTSANFGFSVGKSIAFGYLPVDLAAAGQRVEIDYLGNRYPASVVATPLYRPSHRPTAAIA